MVKLTRNLFAFVLITFEFTNLFTFVAEGGATPSTVQHSRYPLEWASYGVAGLIIFLEPGAAQRLLRKGVTWWAFATLVLLTWAMLVRTFNAPAGWPAYLFLRDFGLTVNHIGFLLTLTVIFDSRDVIMQTKGAIVIATLVAVLMNAYDLLHPGIFSVIIGRAAGFYVDPNMSGMAIAFGCLLGLTWIRTVWMRECFVLCCAAGILATASREAMLSFTVIVLLASCARALPARRLFAIVSGTIALFTMFGVVNRLSESKLFTENSLSRLTLKWSDASAHARANTDRYTLKLVEESPLLGQGYGTQVFWTKDTATHNMYLDFMVDCGVIGVLVIPGLIFSVSRKTWDSYAFALAFGMWGLFNHELLIEFFSLITLAIQANESYFYKQALHHNPLSPRRFPPSYGESLSPSRNEARADPLNRRPKPHGSAQAGQVN